MKCLCSLLSFALIFLHMAPLYEALFYPASSVLQVTASVSVPVEEYFPERRILLDWCFQMNYDLPFNVSSFYNMPIWPGKHNPKVRRDLATRLSAVPSSEALNTSRVPVAHEPYEKYEQNPSFKRRHPNDFTAGEFYQGLEDILASFGIHETCLLRSVCDLARHPFDEAHQNIFTELLTFILSPSLHEAFDSSEQLYREVYEEAEQRGFMGEECQALFDECKHDILGSITKCLNG